MLHICICLFQLPDIAAIRPSNCILAHAQSGMQIRRAYAQGYQYAFVASCSSAHVCLLQSNTAKLYLANEIERRYGKDGLHATAVHPGGILTNVSRHLPEETLQYIMVTRPAQQPQADLELEPPDMLDMMLLAPAGY